MKNFKSFFSKVALPTLFVAVLSLAGCQKEIPPDDQEGGYLQMEGKYKRTVELRDGETVVTLGIGSDKQECLDDFIAGLAINALVELPVSEDPTTLPPALKAAPESYNEENAIHICVLNQKLAPGVLGFELKVNSQEDSTSGKTDESGTFSGPKTFYSFEANHSFYVRPNNGNCVSAWFSYRSASTSWAWRAYSAWGGSGGWYRCTSSIDKFSSNNSIDIRLKAQGANFYVIWD